MLKTLEKDFQQLEEARRQITALAASCTEHQLYFKPDSDKWSVVQVLTHLMSTEQDVQAYMRKKLSQPHLLANSGLKSWFRAQLVSLALRHRKKIKAPAAVRPPADNLTFEQVQEQWTIGRNQLSQLLQTWPDELADKEVFRHPLAGMFNLHQTLGFMREHVLHHIPQIRRLQGLAN